MKKYSLYSLVAMLCYMTLSSFQCIKEVEYPFMISSIYPLTGDAGDTITIVGKDFLFDSTGSRYAFINDKKAPFILETSDSLKFIVPLKAGDGDIRIYLGRHNYSTYRSFHYQYTAVVTTIAGTGDTGNFLLSNK